MYDPLHAFSIRLLLMFLVDGSIQDIQFERPLVKLVVGLLPLVKLGNHDLKGNDLARVQLRIVKHLATVHGQEVTKGEKNILKQNLGALMRMISEGYECVYR